MGFRSAPIPEFQLEQPCVSLPVSALPNLKRVFNKNNMQRPAGHRSPCQHFQQRLRREEKVVWGFCMSHPYQRFPQLYQIDIFCKGIADSSDSRSTVTGQPFPEALLPRHFSGGMSYGALALLLFPFSHPESSCFHSVILQFFNV